MPPQEIFPAPVRILVVEDDWVARSFLSDALSDLGVVVPCSSAEEAEKLLSSGEVRFDLIISDVVMGGNSGISLLHYVRDTLGLETIPFLVYTAHNDPRLEEMAFSAGATDLIDKPTSMARLRQRVQANLRMIRAVAREELAPLAEHEIFSVIASELQRACAGLYGLSLAKVSLTSPLTDRLPNAETATSVVYEAYLRARNQQFLPLLRDQENAFWVLALHGNPDWFAEHIASLSSWLTRWEGDRRMPHGLQMKVTEVIVFPAKLLNGDESGFEELMTALQHKIEELQSSLHSQIDSDMVHVCSEELKVMTTGAKR